MAVTLDSAKAHLNVTGSADDALIGGLIVDATAFLEELLGYAIATRYPLAAPAPLDRAVLLTVGHWYENREATIGGVSMQPVPFGVWDIVNEFREFSFGEANA